MIFPMAQNLTDTEVSLIDAVLSEGGRNTWVTTGSVAQHFPGKTPHHVSRALANLKMELVLKRSHFRLKTRRMGTGKIWKLETKI